MSAKKTTATSKGRATKTVIAPTRTRKPKPAPVEEKDPREEATNSILDILSKFDHHGQNAIISQILTHKEMQRESEVQEAYNKFDDLAMGKKNFYSMCQSFKGIKDSTNA